MLRNFILGHHDKAITAWLRRIPRPLKLMAMIFGAGLFATVLLTLRRAVACVIDYGAARQRLRAADTRLKRQANRVRELEREIAALEARLATRYRPRDVGLFKQRNTDNAA